MGHLSHHKSYLGLQARLDQMPSGFPLTEEGMAVLQLLFKPEEAELVARMPFKPMSAKRIAERVKMDQAYISEMLDRMADCGLIIDYFHPKYQKSFYCVAPPVVGFFEFSMMRIHQGFDQKALSQAYDDYFFSPGSLAYTISNGETQIGRTLVYETALDDDDLAEMLTYEKASEVVGTASAWGVSMCYCRHKAEHLGHRCEAPIDNCMSLNRSATMLARRDLAKLIDREQALEILDQSRQASLVFIGDNVQQNLSYICSCCKCCCVQLQAINRLGLTHAVKTSSFLAVIDQDKCRGCGRCSRACPVQAIRIHSLPPHIKRKARMYSVVDEGLCLGCGVCKAVCKNDALTMRFRGHRVLTPVGMLERVLSMALERDKLQHLLFDHQEGIHMLFLNRFIGAVLRMPPVKQLLVRDQLKSRFIGWLASQFKG